MTGKSRAPRPPQILNYKFESVLDRQCLRPREVAEAYGIGIAQQTTLIKAGALHSVKIMGRRLIGVASLERLVAKGITTAEIKNAKPSEMRGR